MKKIFLIYSMLMLSIICGHAQSNEAYKKEYSFNFSAYCFIGKKFPGWAVSGSFGIWKGFSVNNKFWLQPSLNTGVTFTCGKNNQGNRNRQHNRSQLNIIYSPMLTTSLGKDKTIYQQISPFYFGHSCAVYNNYKTAITIGTSVVSMPKGRVKNIATPRNRSQQLAYVSLKVGHINSVRSFTLNLYEDFIPGTEKLFQFLADNRDRYYTGGVNFQFRFDSSSVLKYYNDVYTGNSYPDLFDHPDVVDRNDSIKPRGGFQRWFFGPQRRKRYTYQDPGQNLFNMGRGMFILQFQPGFNRYTENFLPLYNKNAYLDIVLYGTYGDKQNMWLQNFVHRCFAINKNIKGTTDKERLHRFKPSPDKDKSKFFTGVQIGTLIF